MGKSGGQVFGGFGHFCGSYSLALAAHVTCLSLLGFGELLSDIFDVDEWIGEIVFFSNSLLPGGFCWETGHTLEVPNGWFDAGEFIPIVQVFLVVILAHLQNNMIESKPIGFDSALVVERVLSGWMIEDKGVHFEVGNKGD